MKRCNIVGLPALEIPKKILLGDPVYTPIQGYTSYKIKDNFIKNQIIGMFPPSFLVGIDYDNQILFQLITSGLNNHIHKDGRRFALNFLISSGGTNVETSFYDDDKNLMESYVIKKNTWSLIHTRTNHCVHNVVGIRKAITISFGGWPTFINPLTDEKYKYLSNLFVDDKS